MTVFSITLVIHICFGSLALLSGVVALSLKKGAKAHRKVGVWFVLTMLGMGITGILLALMRFNALFIVIGVYAMYLAGSGWRAATRPINTSGSPEKWILFGSSVTTLATAAVGVYGVTKGLPITGVPAELYLLFALDGIVFSLLDASVLRRGGLAGPKRIADHVWRVVMALIFAATALFIANSQVLPPGMQTPYFTFGPVALLYVALVYWLVRVIAGKRFA